MISSRKPAAELTTARASRFFSSMRRWTNCRTGHSLHPKIPYDFISCTLYAMVWVFLLDEMGVRTKGRASVVDGGLRGLFGRFEHVDLPMLAANTRDLAPTFDYHKSKKYAASPLYRAQPRISSRLEHNHSAFLIDDALRFLISASFAFVSLIRC